MARKKMYKRGKKINTISHLVRMLQDDRYIYLFGRPINPGFVLSLQVRTLLVSLQRGSVYVAELND